MAYKFKVQGSQFKVQGSQFRVLSKMRMSNVEQKMSNYEIFFLRHSAVYYSAVLRFSNLLIF